MKTVRCASVNDASMTYGNLPYTVRNPAVPFLVFSLRDFMIAYASRRVKMDLNTFIVIYWYRKYRQQQRISNRRFWVHPIVSQRNILSSFNTLMCQLRQDETKLFNYFRMSIPTFDDLLRRVEINLTRQDTNMRASISPEEKLSICLR
ncbi:hypothetical protein QTP88_010583 [Uroleucon formosanum]